VTIEEYVPLSRRIKGLGLSGPFDGVQDWMLASLHQWCDDRFRTRWGANAELLQIVELTLQVNLGFADADTRLERLYTRMINDRSLFLDVLDLLLKGIHLEEEPRRVAEALDINLRIANSVWTVLFNGRDASLVKRIDDVTFDGLAKTMALGGRSAEHLRLAWSHVYGRKVDASSGYRESVRAVEAAGGSIVLPKDPAPTLGLMIKALRAKPSKWKMALEPDGIDPVLSLATTMELLWKSQLDRHGTEDESRPLNVGPKEAEAALHLAIGLVHIFKSKAVVPA
jgi:hypothetical protein